MDSQNHSTNEQQSRLLWNAAKFLTIGVAERLQYNRIRYRESYQESNQLSDVLKTCELLIVDVQSYQNILAQLEESTEKSFLTGAFIILQKIDNRLHELHHKLIFWPAESILPIIPDLDEQRKIWAISDLETDIELPDLSTSESSLQAIFSIENYIRVALQETP